MNIIKESKRKIQAPTKTSESVRLGILLATVGGFLDAYTFICRGGVFANAQTGNIVLIGVEATKGNFRQAFMAFLPILAFIIGIVVTEKIKEFKFPSSTSVTYSERIILLIEIIILFIIGFIPTTVSNAFVTIPISFASSVQIATFAKLVDSPYSTTMCTGNLRSASQAAYKAFVKKDSKSVIKVARYSMIILSFIIGGCFAGILTSLVGVKSIWFAVIVLIFSVALFTVDEHKFKEH
ncbi:MAG: YoaK family protein [Bacilli bacterium]|nr:YoaK family protein [Bacilli bacterium]